MKSTPATKAELERSLFGKVGKRYQDEETQLVYSVIEYLSLVLGLRAYRRNVGMGEWISAEGKKRMVRFNEPGQSDVWAIGPRPTSTHIEIELKVAGKGSKSEPTELQRVWLEDMRKAGAIGLCVTSLKDCAVQLKAAFEAKGIEWKASWDL